MTSFDFSSIDFIAVGAVAVIAILIIGGAYVRQVVDNRQIRRALEHAKDQLERANQEIKEEKRRQEQGMLDNAIQSLRQRNPDLGVVIDVVKAQQVDLDGQEAVLVANAKNDWRSILFDIGQNVFFFALGVVTPIVLNHLHVN